MIFQYLTVSCIPASGHVHNISVHVYLLIGYVPNISRHDTGHLLIVADILQHVPSKIPDIDCSWHFMASLPVIIFPGRNRLELIESSCL